MRDLNELEKKLRAEVNEAAISQAVETALLKEFDKKWGRGFRPMAGLPPGVYVAAITLLAACLLLAVSLKFKRVEQLQPKAVAAVVEQPAPQIMPAAQTKSRARRRRARQAADPEPEFLRIPYTTPLASYERAEVVRVELPVSALAAAGFQIATADAGARAQADLIVGQDGMARAVRLISISSN